MPEQTDIDYWRQRYLAAAHGMQTGVAYTMERDPSESSPKHLRVGVNSAMVEQGALVKLLIAKRVFSELEFVRAQAEAMETERDTYQERLSREYGANITLA